MSSIALKVEAKTIQIRVSETFQPLWMYRADVCLSYQSTFIRGIIQAAICLLYCHIFSLARYTKWT